MDFNYVVQRQEKGKVCFGSGLERQLLDSDKKGLVSKFARTYMSERYDVGPASYNITVQTSALNRVLNKPTSNLGTVLGGRKAVRKDINDDKTWVPGPIYDIPTTFPTEFKQSCAPFNSFAERAKPQTSEVPGPGIYKVAPYKRRRIAFGHSFGGSKCLHQVVKMKCGPFNYDTCERCQQYPEGDYWYLDKIKIRDCSKVHFHDGCKAKLFLVSPQEIAKVKEREGYLSLYFS